MKKAFTLIELLIVIGILGVLMTTMLVSLSGSGDSAKAAKCLTNMRNLATAVQAYGVANAYYPHAGSITRMSMNSSGGKKNQHLEYNEMKGWVSWNSKDVFPSTSPDNPNSIGLYETDPDLGRFAITNGAIWAYMGGDSSTYVCPVHAKKHPSAKWSYLMNAYFGWAASQGHAYSSQHYGLKYGNLGDADRILLFAEVPFQGPGDWKPDEGAGDMDGDGVLQYVGCKTARGVAGKNCRDGNEHIGANHKSGRDWFAHVVFADGHTEKLRCSTSKGLPLGGDDMRELTTWLCTGKAVTFDGKKYEELK